MSTYHRRKRGLLEKLVKELIEELKQDPQVYNDIVIYSYLNRAFNSKLQKTSPKKERTKNIPVIQYNKFGSIIGRFNSYAEAQLYTGIKATAISNVINGLRMTAGGYYWKPKNRKDKV